MRVLSSDTVSYTQHRSSLRALSVAAALLLGACSTASPEATIQIPGAASTSLAPSTASSPTTSEPVAVEPTEEDSTSQPAETLAASTTTSTSTSTTTSTTEPSPSTVTPTSTTEPSPSSLLPDSVVEPACVMRSTGTSFEQVATDLAAVSGVAVTGEQLWIENGFADAVTVGDLIDTCDGNGLNDIDGSENPPPNDAAVNAARAGNVERQQRKLNELFADVGSGDLATDGDSGALTGQRLCGARLGLGLDTSTADMAPGSTEEATLMSASKLSIPTSVVADESERWIVIDRTCQLLFAGTGTALTFAFNTSTGTEGFETRLQDRAPAFRFNPAVDNGGWHNSSEFPVGVDNPRNGNMYKPLYFDLGQAIHGANYVPPVPDSKGCARLRVGDQNQLVSWIGLADAPGETWRKSEMDVTITVQGEFTTR
jgi:hypothetical protein